MDKYYKNILKSSSFIKNINIGDIHNYNNKYKNNIIPSLNLINYDLIRKTSTLNENLIITLPNLYYSHYWSVLLFGINEINTTLFDFDISNKYKRGQKLLFNDKYIVEFVSFLENGGIRIKTSDATWTLIREFTGILKAINSKKKLSPLKNILKGLSDRDFKLKLLNRRHPIDRILSTNTMGDLPEQSLKIVLHTKSSNFLEFCSKRNINGFNIDKILNFGNIDQNGDIQYLGSGQNANINILLTNDLLNIESFCEQNIDSNKILISDNINHISNHYGTWKDLKENNFNSSVLFCEYSNFEKVSNLDNSDSIFFHYNTNIIKSLNFQKEHHYFDNIASSLQKNLKLTVDYKISDFPELQDIVLNLNSIDKKISEDNYLFKSDYVRLYSLVLLFSRLVFRPMDNYLNEIHNTLQGIKNNISKHELFVETETIDIINLCLDYFDLLIDKTKKIKKIELLHEIIRDNKNKNIYLLVQKKDHINLVKSFWFNELHTDDSNKIDFISMPELLNNESLQNLNKDDNMLIVCGWLNKSNMQKIIFEQPFFSNITMLFYNHEYNWFNSVVNFWKKSFNNIESTSSFYSKYKINSIDSNNEYISNIFPSNNQDIKTDIIEFENRINNFSNSKYQTDDRTKSISVKKYYLSNHKIIYSTKTHKFIILKNLFDDDCINISDRDNLKVNDTIIISKTGDDLIKNKANELLLKDNYNNSREIAYEWISALHHCLKNLNMNINSLRSDLKKYEIDIPLHTLRYWLFDNSIIGPKKIDTIDIIYNMSKNIYNWKYDTSIIKKSIEIIRSYHLKAGFRVRKEFLSNIKDTINKIDVESFNSKDYYEIDTSEYGRIIFYKIINFDSDSIMIDSAFANHLFEDVL